MEATKDQRCTNIPNSFQILEHRLDIYIICSWQSIKLLLNAKFLSFLGNLALTCTNHTDLSQVHLPRPQITQTKRHLKLEAGGYLKCARKQFNSHNICGGAYMLVQESLNLLLNIKSWFSLDYIWYIYICILVCWLHLTSSHVKQHVWSEVSGAIFFISNYKTQH